MDLTLNLLLPHVVLINVMTQLQIHGLFYYEKVAHKLFSLSLRDLHSKIQISNCGRLDIITLLL